VVVCAVLVSLAYPLREFFAQRGEIERLQAQERATEQRVAALRRQQQRWADPAYVKTQARQRLHFVLPGETAYVVLDPGSRANRSPNLLPPVQPDARAQPWYSELWRTIETADRTASAGGAAGR
jgi:hypothetical protein